MLVSDDASSLSNSFFEQYLRTISQNSTSCSQLLLQVRTLVQQFIAMHRSWILLPRFLLKYVHEVNWRTNNLEKSGIESTC